MKKNRLNQKIFRNNMLTTIFTEFAFMIATLIDGLVVGRFTTGYEAMAAIGVATPLVSFFAIFSGVMATGAQNVTAKKLAVADLESAKKIFNLSVFVALIFSVSFGILSFIFTDQIVSLFGAGKALGSTHDIACIYLRGLIPEFPAFMLITILNPFLYLDGARKRINLAILTYIITNVVLDLIVGFLFDGNIFGIAMATTLSNWVWFLVLVTHCFKKDVIFKINLGKIDFTYLKDILLIGQPVATRRVCNVLRKAVMNIIIASVASGYGLAALSIQGQIKDVGDTLGIGIGKAILLMVGIAVGECSAREVKNIFSIGLGYIRYAIFFGLLIAFGSPLIARAFHPDANALPYVTFALCCYGISLPFLVFNYMYINFLQGSGHTGYANILSILQRVAYVLPCSFILAKLWGMKGLFLAFPISEFLIALTVVVGLQLKQKKFLLRMEDFLMLPEDFESNVSEQKDWIITDFDQVMQCAEEIHNFCKHKKMNEKHSYYLSLMVEEIGKNIVEYGFKNEKGHSLNLRILHKKDGTWTIRFRDDCTKFDPTEINKYSETYFIDKTKNFGLKIVFGLAKDVKYVNAMGINTLIITM